MDTVLLLCPSLPAETFKWLSSLPILMQESFWWWQCSDRYIISLSPHLHTPYPPFSPSLISLMVSVDVKHHIYLLAPALRSLHNVEVASWKLVWMKRRPHSLICDWHQQQILPNTAGHRQKTTTHPSSLLIWSRALLWLCIELTLSVSYFPCTLVDTKQPARGCDLRLSSHPLVFFLFFFHRYSVQFQHSEDS